VVVYVLIIVGVYVLSTDVDFVGQILTNLHMRRSLLSAGTASTPFGEAVLTLLGAWQRQKGPVVVETEEGKACELALREVLQTGCKHGTIKDSEVIELIMLLLQEQGLGPNAAMVHWAEANVEHFKKYVQHDPAFQDRFRHLLSEAEHQRLLSISRSRHSDGTFVSVEMSDGDRENQDWAEVAGGRRN